MKNESHELLENLSFCVIDLETTGGNHEYDQIIEIGMVRVNKLQIKEEKHILLNPEIAIPDFIQKLTSIKQDDVRNSPLIKDKIDEIINFIGTDILVAHNTSFDIPFLNSVLKRLNRPTLSNKVLCTNVMTKYLIPEILSSNLNYMSQLFCIEHQQAHRAIEDALAAAKLMLNYLKFFEEKGIKKVNQLYYPRNRFELDRLHLEKDQIKFDQFAQIIKKLTAPAILMFKGKEGQVVAITPYEEQSDLFLVEQLWENPEWEQVSLRLMAPFPRIILTMSPHWPKIAPNIAKEITEHWQKKYPLKASLEDAINQYDFIIADHLIENQFTVFNFMFLTHNSYLVTKYPNHRKKISQFLKNHFSRFEQQSNGKRKWQIDQSLQALLAGYLENKKGCQELFYISKDIVKEDNQRIIAAGLESYTLNMKNEYAFPMNHI